MKYKKAMSMYDLFKNVEIDISFHDKQNKILTILLYPHFPISCPYLFMTLYIHLSITHPVL